MYKCCEGGLGVIRAVEFSMRLKSMVREPQVSIGASSGHKGPLRSSSQLNDPGAAGFCLLAPEGKVQSIDQ